MGNPSRHLYGGRDTRRPRPYPWTTLKTDPSRPLPCRPRLSRYFFLRNQSLKTQVTLAEGIGEGTVCPVTSVVLLRASRDTELGLTQISRCRRGLPFRSTSEKDVKPRKDSFVFLDLFSLRITSGPSLPHLSRKMPTSIIFR